MKEVRYLSAREAAGELGVSLSTLYAYVSRGLVRSEATEGKKRNRRYRAEDVRRLKERAEQRRDPGKVAEGALYWGAPVMESGIALISGGRLYYRGRDAGALASESTIEEVAALIWAGDPKGSQQIFGAEPPNPFSRYCSVRDRVAGLTPVEAFQVLLPLAAVEDFAAYDLRPAAVARTGARILRQIATIASGEEIGGSVAETLQRGWVPGDLEATVLFNAALILCADHELNVSTFAARCVASSEATPYSVVTAGLAALQGVRHGGQTELVEAFLREVEASGDARRVIAGRLKRGEGVPGFGHSLYPDGDPRGAGLLRLVDRYRLRSHVAAEFSAVVAREALEILDEHPTVDFGLVTLARALDLPPGGAIALFAMGRTVGWIGHAIEQYASGSLIRPRARYVGEQP